MDNGRSQRGQYCTTCIHRVWPLGSRDFVVEWMGVGLIRSDQIGSDLARESRPGSSKRLSRMWEESGRGWGGVN